jgi:hypothetical protein
MHYHEPPPARRPGAHTRVIADVITASGRVRNTVYYSILDDERPAVRARLRDRLNGPHMPAIET